MVATLRGNVQQGGFVADMVISGGIAGNLITSAIYANALPTTFEGSNITALNASSIATGTLAVGRGGTGVTTATGTGSVVLSNAPTLSNAVTFTTNNVESAQINTQGVVVKVGSSTTPSLSFSGDLSTGIYRPQANVIGFSSGGTEKVQIKTTGLKVTSGTLQQQGTDDNPSLLALPNPCAYFAASTLNVADGGVIFGSLNGNSPYIAAARTKDGGGTIYPTALQFYTNDTSRVTVAGASGNVGIGTTSPSSTLQVVGDILCNRLVSSTGISVTNNDPGPFIEKRYGIGASNDRYGIGQFTGGALRLYIAQAYPYSKICMCLATGETTFSDLLVANSTSVTVNRNLIVPSGLIQRGDVPVSGTSDLGLYSRISGHYMRFVVNAGTFVWFVTEGATGAGGAVGMSLNGSSNLQVTGTVSGASDDRLKSNEEFIENALATLIKLRPQLYNKKLSLDAVDEGNRESGLIAQEVWYDAPELRHLVFHDPDATIPENIPTSANPAQDPDYSSWGATPAAMNYIGLIPYLIKAVQEQQQHIQALEARLAAIEG